MFWRGRFDYTFIPEVTIVSYYTTLAGLLQNLPIRLRLAEYQQIVNYFLFCLSSVYAQEFFHQLIFYPNFPWTKPGKGSPDLLYEHTL